MREVFLISSLSLLCCNFKPLVHVLLSAAVEKRYFPSSYWWSFRCLKFAIMPPLNHLFCILQMHISFNLSSCGLASKLSLIFVSHFEPSLLSPCLLKKLEHKATFGVMLILNLMVNIWMSLKKNPFGNFSVHKWKHLLKPLIFRHKFCFVVNWCG